MKLKAFYCLFIVLMSVGLASHSTSAQAPAASSPAPNALLIYDKTTAALINTSSTPLSLKGLSFMRHDGAVNFNAGNLLSSLAPGRCIQVWTADVRQVIGKPPECT